MEDSQRDSQNDFHRDRSTNQGVVILRLWKSRRGKAKGGFGHISLEVPSKGIYASVLPGINGKARLANNLQDDITCMSRGAQSENDALLEAQRERSPDQKKYHSGLDLDKIAKRFAWFQEHIGEFTFSYVSSVSIPSDNSLYQPPDDFNPAWLENRGIDCVVFVKDLLEHGGVQQPTYSLTDRSGRIKSGHYGSVLGLVLLFMVLATQTKGKTKTAMEILFLISFFALAVLATYAVCNAAKNCLQGRENVVTPGGVFSQMGENRPILTGNSTHDEATKATEDQKSFPDHLRAEI